MPETASNLRILSLILRPCSCPCFFLLTAFSPSVLGRPPPFSPALSPSSQGPPPAFSSSLLHSKHGTLVWPGGLWIGDVETDHVSSARAGARARGDLPLWVWFRNTAGVRARLHRASRNLGAAMGSGRDRGPVSPF